MTHHPYSLTRRSFLKASAACSAHMALMAAPFPRAARRLWSERSRGRVVAQEAFGRLEEMGDGLWAFISTPLTGDYTTVSNGGIMAGENGVLVVEAFQTPEGAAWVARQARDLIGRWPTHVVVTHYHGDHTSGASGFFNATPPRLHATEATRNLVAQGFSEDTPEAAMRPWADVVILPPEAPSTLELGGRTVKLEPRRGHTSSDVTVELPEAGITWCGDLVWNGMFPNYMDAEPSRLSRAVRAIQAQGRTMLVPGHGPLADPGDMDRYLAVIDGLEETAREARREGWTAEEAGQRHRIPETLGEWTLFNPSYFQRAVEAWMREWQG